AGARTASVGSPDWARAVPSVAVSRRAIATNPNLSAASAGLDLVCDPYICASRVWVTGTLVIADWFDWPWYLSHLLQVGSPCRERIGAVPDVVPDEVQGEHHEHQRQAGNHDQ